MDIWTLDNLYIIIKLLAIPTALRAYVWATSLRIYGVYTLYKNRENIFKHPIFVILDLLYTNEELFSTITDAGRREIFKDIFRLEIYALNEICLSIRAMIYDNKGFFQFIKDNRYLDSHEVVRQFLRLFNAHRDKMKVKIYRKLKQNGMQKDKIEYVANKYYEFTAQNSYILRERMELKKFRNNLYYTFLDILEIVLIEINAQKVFLPIKFMALNGKLDGIEYKTIHTTDTKSKVEAV